ncbi:leucine-rich repeat domain-containing protein [Chaetoceros tenuissimus]|uniref:Leucine-rich repeat domain-containing protein n=1 Tax=Chaetoceros tenuissimus TaxID=426638 RepID=A0AAD3CK69_9STRA|nr:leucine-rich repeat domain-containing protein [Chaetoceros tenuissimus]
MRVKTEEWRRFIPGVRMYKGMMTLFYNGEKLWEEMGFNGHPLVYDYGERESWEVIIILPGVEVIPELTFFDCSNIKKVIMADSVRRIEGSAFFTYCDGLEFIRLSRSLEFIGKDAFYGCVSLTSIFIPPSCREIDEYVFERCTKLIILGLPQNVELGEYVFQNTALIEASPIETDENGYYDRNDDEIVIQWIKSINNEEVFALHRACASYNPLPEIIHALVQRLGIKAMRMPNAIEITPSQYLAANPFTDISEKDIINRYILDSMGEV